MSEILEALTTELQAHGVTEWRVTRRSKHPAIEFSWHDGTLRYVYAGTSSDRRSADNAVSDLRRMMGVKRVVVKSEAPKRMRNRTTSKKTITLETFARDNPLAVLADAKDKAKARVVEAEVAGRRAFMCGMCGRPPDDFAPHLAKAYMRGWWGAQWIGRE